jgi:excisionase family DNA binding protein
MGDELLTVDQAAERLQMHADTVRRLLREGQLPGRKVGARQWRISADALKAYVEGIDKPAAPKAE